MEGEREIWNSETALAVLFLGSRGCWSSREKKTKTDKNTSVNSKFYCISDMRFSAFSCISHLILFPVLGGGFLSLTLVLHKNISQLSLLTYFGCVNWFVMHGCSPLKLLKQIEVHC